METLETLVRRAQAGDQIAFGEIVRLLDRRAVAAAHLIAGDLHRGEEAAQDAFVTAWRKLSSLRDPVAFETKALCDVTIAIENGSSPGPRGELGESRTFS